MLNILNNERNVSTREIFSYLTQRCGTILYFTTWEIMCGKAELIGIMFFSDSSDILGTIKSAPSSPK